MKLSQILNRLRWFRKGISWNLKYKKGKWDYLGDEELRYSTIVKYIQNTGINKPKILDLGCGFGALKEYLNPQDYGFCTGVDISSVAIKRAKSKYYPNCEFIVADIHRFFPDSTFDIIIFNEVLYYLDNQIEIVERFATNLNPGGYFIFSFYGIREDLIDEIGQRYELIAKEVISQSEQVFWGICLYKV